MNNDQRLRQIRGQLRLAPPRAQPRTRSAFTGRTFSKAVVLLTSPRTRKVPLGADKLKLYLSKNIIDAVQIPLHSNEESLQKFFTELFTEKLGEARITRIMINVGHNLVCPNLPPGESLTGLNLKKVTGQGKYIYLLPSAELPKPKIPEDYYDTSTLSDNDEGVEEKHVDILPDVNSSPSRDSDDPDVQVVAAPLPAPRTSRPASTSATTRLPMTTATHQPLATASTTTRLATTSTTSRLTLASTTPPLTMTTTQQPLATVSTSSQSIDLTTFQIPETEEESMEAALTEAVRTHNKSERTVTDILKTYMSRLWRVDARSLNLVSEDSSVDGLTVPICVTRDDIISSTVEEIIDALEVRAVEAMDVRLPLEVTFKSEDCEDLGGPRREFFELFLSQANEIITRNGELINDEEELIRVNCADRLYYVYGFVTGLSVLQGGPTNPLKNLEEEGEQFRQVRDGLARSGLWQLMQKIPDVKSLMTIVKIQQHTTPTRFLRIFTKDQTGEPGSNLRRRQDTIYGTFVKWLRSVFASQRVGIMGEKIKPEDVLQFVTGSRYEPLLGFGMKPSISYKPHVMFMPTSSTCTNTLYLPLPDHPATPFPNEDEQYKLFDNAFTTKIYGFK